VLSPDIADPARYVNDLVNYIAGKRITLEVCLTSNLQTKPELRDLRCHPLGKMLGRRLSATLCTDNRLVSNPTISREIRLAVDSFDIDPKTLKNMIIYGFKRSFYPGSYTEKRDYVRRVISRYEAVARKHGIAETAE